MDSKMIYFDIFLETIGPLFIGNGEKYQKSEYILNTYEKKFYVMDTLKMFQGLKKINMLNEYEKWVLSQPKNVNMFKFVDENHIKSTEYSKWARYKFSLDNAGELHNAEVCQFMKDAYNNPYVSGSSLKGAIRNAILNSELLNSSEMDELSIEKSVDSFKSRKKYLAKESSDIDIKLFHTLKRSDKSGRIISDSNPVNSVFQGLRISDSKPLFADTLGLYQKIDYKPDGTFSKLNLLRECIKPGTCIEFAVEIDPTTFPYSPNDIISCINDMYRNEQEKFMRFFPKLPQQAGNMIYIGGGTGYITKTATYSFFKDQKMAVKNASIILDNTDSKDKKGKHLEDPRKYGISPHTRKLTISGQNKYEFGLCRLTIKEKKID